MRLLSYMKIVMILLHTDLSWTETPAFHSFITCVIVLNSIIFGLERDLHSNIWLWAEETMHIVYAFEMFVRFKRWGWDFFLRREDWAWNQFDFFL